MTKIRIYDRFDFFGAQFQTVEKATFTIGQIYYANGQDFVSENTPFEDFHGKRALFSWLCHTRPNISWYAKRTYQVSEKTYGKDEIIELNRGVKAGKKDLDTELKHGPLEKASLHLIVYADASFASNNDLSSQVVYIILLCDASAPCNVLNFASKIFKRVVRPIMVGGAYAFIEVLDTSFVVKKAISSLLNMEILIFMFTDSKQLLDAMTKWERTIDKREIIDTLAARQSYKSFGISRVGFTSGEGSPADGMTKPKGNDMLRNLFVSKVDVTAAKQWIHRPKRHSLGYSIGP